MFKRKTKKLILMLFLIITTLIFGTGNVKGMYISTLLNDSHIYCVQKHASYHGGNYSVVKTISISTASANAADRKLAFILGGGSDSKGYGWSYNGGNTPRQKAVWGYWNSWISESGRKGSLSGWIWGPNNQYKGSTVSGLKKFLKKGGDGSPAQIKNKGAKKLLTSNAMAGPFNVEYQGKLSIVVKDVDGNEITNGIKFYVNNKPVNASDIQSKQTFYIGNTSGKILKQAIITATPTSSTTINAKMQLLRNSSGQQRLIRVTTGTTKNKPVSIEVEIVTYGSITINKQDVDSKKALNGAQFKLKSPTKGWITGEANAITHGYTNNVNQAGVYTAANGTIKVSNLVFDTYEIYETKAPEGYILSEQTGYSNGMVKLGRRTISPTSQNAANISATFTNVKYISIKGYVWIDVPNTKSNTYNSLYDNGETRVSGVKVRLMSKSGKQIGTATTDGNGEYKFDKLIKESQVKDSYVEFNYAGTNYKRYIPVAFNSTDINKIVENGSRALMSKVPEWDENNTGIATTYKGSKEETKYGLSGNLYTKLFKAVNEKGETNILQNINLGIKKIPNVDYTINQDIDHIKVTINGYTYTYNYGTKGNKNFAAAPTVNWQAKNNIAAYTRDIYPSDIVFKPADKTKQLEIYVTYRTDIKNTTDINIPELYTEKALHVTTLQNQFDTKRYELSDKNWEMLKGKTNIVASKDSYIKDIKETGIKPGNTATKYITFKVKRDTKNPNNDAVLQILNNPRGIIEQLPTLVGAAAYHEFTRTDYSWDNNITKQQIHKVKDIVRTSRAPYLILKLGNQRTLTGTVFEDSIDLDRNKQSGEVVGNGIYEKDKEKTVAGVKVQLLTNIKDIADLYHIKYTNGTKLELTDPAKIEKAETTTGADGTFILNDVVPGDYYLRFIYGNGDYKIISSDGTVAVEGTLTETETSKIDNNKISAKEYKSTIITSEAVKDGIENGSKVKDTEHVWYKKLIGQDKQYSVAIDNLKTRVEVNKKEETNTLNAIDANTPKLSITVENSVNPTSADETLREQKEFESDDGTKVTQLDANGNLNEVAVPAYNTSATVKNTFGGLNLGVIKQPQESARIDKIISNMKLVNAQGNLIFEGNPESTQMQGVSDLDNTKNDGSVFTRAEVDEEQMYGSTLTVTYLITVTNTSDTNYYERKYYVYGDKTGAHEVTLTVEEVTDYLDPALTYVAVSEGKTVTEATAETTTESTEVTAKETKNLKITGWEVLYTENNKERSQDKQNAVKTSDSAGILTQKILSTQDDDMEFINEAQITDAHPSPESGDYDSRVDATKNTEVATTKQVVKVNETPAKATIIITPPTGADLKTILIYTGVTVLALAVLSAGVIIIKKRIL